MFLIIGLGNPGKKFVNNRHNIGFKIIDSFVKSLGFNTKDYKIKFNSEYIKLSLEYIDTNTNVNKIKKNKEQYYKNFDLNKSILTSSSITSIKDLILIKPLNYMNNSGISVLNFFNYYKEKIEKILVIHDDTDIDYGFIKFKSGGSSGGHKGLESIIKYLNTDKFDRLRFGVGKPFKQNIDLADYVLSDFTSEESKTLNLLIEYAIDSIKKYIINGIDYVMNIYNKKNLLL